MCACVCGVCVCVCVHVCVCASMCVENGVTRARVSVDEGATDWTERVSERGQNSHMGLCQLETERQQGSDIVNSHNPNVRVG